MTMQTRPQSPEPNSENWYGKLARSRPKQSECPQPGAGDNFEPRYVKRSVGPKCPKRATRPQTPETESVNLVTSN